VHPVFFVYCNRLALVPKRPKLKRELGAFSTNVRLDGLDYVDHGFIPYVVRGLEYPLKIGAGTGSGALLPMTDGKEGFLVYT